MMKRPFWNLVSSLYYSSSSSSYVLKPGVILKQARIFSLSDITEYSKLTHDHNPLHFDLESARNAGFTDVPVPGLLVASLFPRIIASYFPGAVYVKQKLDFRAPVFVGDEITGEVQATNIRQVKEKFMVKFVTTCLKNGDAVVIGGVAIAMLPTLRSLLKCRQPPLDKVKFVTACFKNGDAVVIGGHVAHAASTAIIKILHQCLLLLNVTLAC